MITEQEQTSAMERQAPFCNMTGVALTEQQLRDQIAYFQARLRRLVSIDDSAYEKLLLRAYERLLKQREAMLTSLLTQQHPPTHHPASL